tara:strand:+ start:5056 stop:5913 length:858 start_codon:yes stop_codon:yes gene_type:complete
MIFDILLPLSLAFIMFTLGLGLTISNFKNVMTYPKAFLIGIINQMIILPFVAFLIASIFNLPAHLGVGMMILACCPGGVTSNIITRFAKGDVALSISYTAVVSIISVITLPVIVSFSYQYFIGSQKETINIIDLGMQMFFITSVPVLLGLFVNSKYKSIADSIRLIADKISIILFIVMVIVALTTNWTLFVNHLEELGLSISALIIIMLFIGYSSARLLNINKSQSITISIESGIQNATVGIAVGNIIADQTTKSLSDFALTSGVYGILMYLVCLPLILIFFRKN